MSTQMQNSDIQNWMPLLVPDMPAPHDLLPWLERMHAARHYSNFGPLVCELEAAFAKIFSLPVKQLTTVTNGTQGLELVLQALDLPPKSHILLPSFTFVATATAVLRAGHVPVLADVDEDTWLLTPSIAHAACKQMRIDAVLPVATFGMPQDMQAWHQFECESGLPVVIDAAAAYGSQWLPKNVQGTLVFSLHTTKSLPAGEGGLVVSSRPDIAEKVRQLSNFGINLQPAASTPVGTLASIGGNAKMSEYHAAVALYSLENWEKNAFERRCLHFELMQRMNEACPDSNFSWQKPGSGGILMAPTNLCIRLPNGKICNALAQSCQKENIMTRRWYLPLLQHMPVLKRKCFLLKTPNAENLASNLLGLPFFRGMNDQQKKRLIDIVKNTVIS